MSKPIKDTPTLEGQDAINFLKSEKYKEMISDYLFIKDKEEIKPIFKNKEELRIFLNKITNKSSDIFGGEIIYGRIDNMIEHAIKIGYVEIK